jgi:exonuclease SbcC
VRLHRLELEGFGPFRERQVVDFDAFACDGIFLISGRTGAGKSSILDGVSFALYGAVPRYDTGDKRLRSDHCEPDDPTEVRLDFTVGDRRWRVTRAPEYQRPSRRGGGFTSEPTRAELEELVDGEWIGRAAKPRDVGLLLDEVLALNAQQFQQVILLAQNKFSRFLLASGAERQSLLRALFGTRRYEEYTRELAERGKAAQRELDAIEARARTLLDQAERLIDAHRLTDDAVAEAPADLAARRARVELAEQRAAYRLDTLQRERIHADAAREAAEAAHATRVAFAKAQTELADARARLDALEKQSETVAADRAVLERGRAAEALRSSLDAARRSEEALRTAAELAAQAQHVWVERASASGMDEDADLDAVVEDLTGELAVWATAASQEAELPAREAELQSAERRLAELRTDLAALDEQRAEIPAELTRLEAAIDDAREAAALLDPARTRLAETESRLAAAREAEALTPALHAAEAAHRDAAAAAATAATAVAALLQRRLDGYAGELAATLVDGEPCAVCGSTAHPHPAPTAPEPVTDEMLGAAESERDGAIVRERTAAEAARAARERHAEALTRAGGAGSDALEELRVAVAA